MKKNSALLSFFILFLAFFSTVRISPLFNNIASADENLSSFQQEILQAKQKQSLITDKAQSVELMVQPDKVSLIQKEAERLMQELASRASQKSEAEAAPSAGIEMSAPEKKETWLAALAKKVVKEKTQIPQKIETKKETKEDPRGWQWLRAVKEVDKISDGEALYKVAISDKKVTLKEAIEIGLSNNVALQAAKKKIEVADAKLVEAKRAMFPTVQAVIERNGGHVGGQVIDSADSVSLVDGQRLYKGENRKININQPLYYGGELVLTVKQAEENLRSSKAEYEKNKSEYIHNLRTAYYGVVKAEYNSQYQKELYEKIDLLYKRAKEEHQHRLIAEVDYLNVESQYHQAYFQMESGKNDLLSADMLLRQALSLDASDELLIDLELHFKKFNPNFDQILGEALQRNPDVLIKQAAFISAQHGLRIFAAKKLPRFDLRGSYGMLGEAFHDTRAFVEGKADNDLEKEWFLGIHGSMPLGPHSIEVDQVKHKYGPTVLALTGSDDWSQKATLNLFDKLSDITDEKGAEAALLQAESDFQKAKDDVTIRVRDEFYNLHKSLIQIDSATAKVRYQEKQNKILEYLLSMQETAMSTYMEALIEQSQDRFSFIQAVSDYHLAISGLSVAIGDPYYFEDAS